jgi:hypothetical protein
MSLDVDTLVSTMRNAGQNLAGGVWSQMKTYALPELHKIALQIVAIGEHLPDYTPEGAKALMRMQINASVAVIVAMTSLTLLAAQTAINQILGAVNDLVTAAIGFPLLA